MKPAGALGPVPLNPPARLKGAFTPLALPTVGTGDVEPNLSPTETSDERAVCEGGVWVPVCAELVVGYDEWAEEDEVVEPIG